MVPVKIIVIGSQVTICPQCHHETPMLANSAFLDTHAPRFVARPHISAEWAHRYTFWLMKVSKTTFVNGADTDMSLKYCVAYRELEDPSIRSYMSLGAKKVVPPSSKSTSSAI